MKGPLGDFIAGAQAIPVNYAVKVLESLVLASDAMTETLILMMDVTICVKLNVVGAAWVQAAAQPILVLP